MFRYDPYIHQRESHRLPEYDYKNPGAYFITICTFGRLPTLGEIKDSKMILSAAGKIAAEEWIKTGNLRKNIRLDEWVVMPNHIHMILWIDDEEGVSAKRPYRNVYDHFSRLSPRSGSLAAIMRAYKSQVVKQCKLQDLDFAWQRNYYEHIIRNEKSLHEIRTYIRNNPQQWELDQENPKHWKK